MRGGIHAAAVIPDDKKGARKGHRATGAGPRVGQNLHLAVAGVDLDLATTGQGVTSVQHQVQQNLLGLGVIHPDQAQVGIKTKLQLDAFPNQPNQQAPHALGDLIEREQSRFATGRARHRQQLPHQASRLQAGAADLLGILAGTVSRLQTGDQEVAVQQHPL